MHVARAIATSDRVLLLLLATAACTSGKDHTDHSGELNAGPELRGFVLSIRDHTVCISGGSRDGVREGDIFVVERIMVGYVGRIKITSVDKDHAVGIRIAGLRAPEPGDKATRDDANTPVHR